MVLITIKVVKVMIENMKMVNNFPKKIMMNGKILLKFKEMVMKTWETQRSKIMIITTLLTICDVSDHKNDKK